MTWHNSVVVLKQQLKQLAAVIGSGLIQALKPFVNAMNSALSGIIKFAQNVVNALGKIFGWEMEINTSGLSMDEDAYDIDTSGLEDVADAAGDAGKATDGAAKSAKKLKEQLQGFDKLNVIRTQDTTDTSGSGGGGGKGKKSGSGGGGGGASGGEVSAAIKKTKSMFESDIDDLYELGKYIGNALSGAMDKIPWNKIYSKASKFGKGLAEFLNGLFADNPTLFDKLGKTVAGCINTALIFLDSFGETFHWKNFGKSLATGLNSFLKNMKWAKYLSAASKWGKGIGDTLAGFLSEADFKAVGNAIGTFIKGQVIFFLSLGSSIPWKDVGDKLADTINGVIETFPAKELAQTINVWVQGIWDLLVEMVKKVDKKKLVSKIKEFIGELDFKTIKIVLTALTLVKGASFVLTVGKALLAEICKQFITKLAAKLTTSMAGSKALETAIGGGLGKAAEKSIGDDTLVGQVSADSGSIIKKIAGIGTTLVGLGTTSTGFYKIWNEGWSTSNGVMVGAGTATSIAGLAMAGVLTGPLALAIAGASAAFTLFAANHDKILTGMGKSWKEFKKSCKEFGKDIQSAFSGTSKSADTSYTKMKNSGISNTTSARKSIDSNYRAILKSVKTNSESSRKTANTEFSNMKTASSKSVKDLGTSVSNTWTSVKNDTQSKLGPKGLQKTVKDRFTDTKTSGTNALNPIKTDVGKMWDSVASTADSKIGGNGKDSVKKKVNKAFGNVKSDGTSAISPIKTDVGKMWDSVGTTAETKIGGDGKNSIKKKVNKSFGSVKKDGISAISPIKGDVAGMWDSIGTSAESKIGGEGKKSVKKKVSSAFGSVNSAGVNALKPISGTVSGVWTSIGNSAASQIDGKGKNTVKSKVTGAFNDVKNSVQKQFPFKLGQVVTDIELPVIKVSKVEKMGTKVAQFGVGKQTVQKYAKAYDTPYVFTRSTLVPSIGRVFGDGNGGEMVYGHDNLMKDIREASGNTAMTDIGNRQLANDQRIIKLLTIIAEKEFGISEDAVFRAARNGASNYTMRTGRGAFEF